MVAKLDLTGGCGFVCDGQQQLVKQSSAAHTIGDAALAFENEAVCFFGYGADVRFLGEHVRKILQEIVHCECAAQLLSAVVVFPEFELPKFEIDTGGGVVTVMKTTPIVKRLHIRAVRRLFCMCRTLK